jgi:hypothetical protein
MLSDPDAPPAEVDAPDASVAPIELERFAPAPGPVVVRSRLEEL